jgi:hypothetical protein
MKVIAGTRIIHYIDEGYYRITGTRIMHYIDEGYYRNTYYALH